MAGTLEEYKKKRKFDNTPEPEGKIRKSKGTLSFVIQKHDATRLHYDFRLEMQGVLKSWAVPKGPSLNPEDKRLAMMVEDHPIEYGGFEGIIPEGNYGAGTVMIWDKGNYYALTEEGEAADEKELLRGLKAGNLKFYIEGEKIKGAYALVKIKNSEGKGNEWLLIKKKDKFASLKDITKKDKSVISGRDLKKIASQSGAGDSVWHSDRESNEKKPRRKGSKPVPDSSAAVPSAPFPNDVKPMLATLVKEPFDSQDWLFEIKWDGYRAIAEVNEREVNLYSRNNLSFNEAYPEIVQSLSGLTINAVLDGEIVAVDEHGNAKFQLIQNYKTTRKGQLVYYVFDILYLNGKDLKDLPLLERKKILKEVLKENSMVKYNDHVMELGIEFYKAAEKNELEGIIGKKKSSKYYEGSRSKDWVKIKTEKRQEAIIAGYTSPRGGRKFFGALILGIYEKKKLKYIGHTGGGFTDATLKQVFQKLKVLEQDDCPFEEIPKTNTKVTWVRPEVLCEVKFQEWTEDGHMRIPIFLGLREDKKPAEVKREDAVELSKVKINKAFHEPALKKMENTTSKATKNIPVKFSDQLLLGKEENDIALTLQKKPLKFSNLSKLYWEEENITKRDLLEYYHKISPLILPYLKDRAENLRRNPNGYKEKSFFQKDMPDSLPDWIQTEKIYSESNDEYLNYLICQNEPTLLYMVNLGCIELNPWLSRIQSLEYPDYIVIDLDPLDVEFRFVIEVAQAVKEVLDKGKIISYPKTSGSRGIHIYIPLGAKYDYDQAKQFAELIATIVHNITPSITSIERMPAKRKNKIYLDYLQNRKGQTLAAPYCVRPKVNATVSAPLEWSEVKIGLSPQDFNMFNIFDRIREKGDLFSGIMGKGNNIQKALELLK